MSSETIKIIVTRSQWKLMASKLHLGYQWQFKFKQGDNTKYQQRLERLRGRRLFCRHSSHRGRLWLKKLFWEQCAQRNAFKMSQTQANELTIGAKQALVGDKRRRGLIGSLHSAAEPFSATQRAAAKNWKLLQLRFFKKRSDILGSSTVRTTRRETLNGKFTWIHRNSGLSWRPTARI